MQLAGVLKTPPEPGKGQEEKLPDHILPFTDTLLFSMHKLHWYSVQRTAQCRDAGLGRQRIIPEHY